MEFKRPILKLPGKFDDGDFDAWLREFDACSTANGWKVTEASDAPKF
jgi:hypothetical protein